MEESFAAESGRLALELHRAISEIDPVRWRTGAADAARAKLCEIQTRLKTLTARRWPGRAATLRARLSELEGTLADGLPDAGAPGRARWMAFRRRLVPAYASLQASLSDFEIHVPSLRPTNHRRALFHVSSGAIAITVLWIVPAPEWTIPMALPVALGAWTLEALRRTRPQVNAALMRFFGPLAHPHEHRRVNSGTWYLSAVALLSLTCAPLPCAVGLTTLAVGDPVAGWVGRRYGRVRLLHGRSLEGTLAFAGASTLAATAVALAFAPALPLTVVLILAATGAASGAVAELVSLRVDDNLTIPLAASGAAALAALALGIPIG